MEPEEGFSFAFSNQQFSSNSQSNPKRKRRTFNEFNSSKFLQDPHNETAFYQTDQNNHEGFVPPIYQRIKVFSDEKEVLKTFPLKVDEYLLKEFSYLTCDDVFDQSKSHQNFETHYKQPTRYQSRNEFSNHKIDGKWQKEHGSLECSENKISMFIKSKKIPEDKVKIIQSSLYNYYSQLNQY